MKKVILIGATLLVASTAIVMANNTNCGSEDCPCPIGVCCPGDKCPAGGDCCQK